MALITYNNELEVAMKIAFYDAKEYDQNLFKLTNAEGTSQNIFN